MHFGLWIPFFFTPLEIVVYYGSRDYFLMKENLIFLFVDC
jgi:hypothetical protein